ncbi:protein indeterminate-domain 2 [Quercus suber]|uniref:Protein indeterminate-domain 2 n=1 Tax=Quercus suber TaxID=58331 RepID=A0AAW0JIL8_QUESU
MMSEDGIPVPSTVGGFVQELNSNPNPNPNSIPLKRKRSLPGTPGKHLFLYLLHTQLFSFLCVYVNKIYSHIFLNPDAEVIALSPKSLMATNRFLCEICNKGFQRDQNLQLHRRGHNLPWKLKQRTNKEVRKKVYVCPEKSCVHHDPSRALGDLTGIKKHFSRKHGEKKWKCEKCSKKYAVQSDWKAHSKICGTREYKCDCGTLFSRKDSFITHRAFCDALAEENARFTSVSAVNQNFKHDLINGTISNPQLPGIPQLPSAFHPEFAGSESVNNLIPDGQKPKLPLWLDNAAQLRQIGITNNSNAYLASLPELVPNASMSNMFGSTSQMQWLNKYPEASFTSADLTISSLPRVLKEEQENKGNLSESGVTLYPNNNQNQQTGPVGDGSMLVNSNSSSFLQNTKNLEHWLMSNNGKHDQHVPAGKHHSSSNEVERSLTRDFLGVGGDASRPFLQQELANFASMGSAMDLSHYTSGHH